MKKTCAFIIIDSGFTREVLKRVSTQVLGAWDLTEKNCKFQVESRNDYLSAKQLERFAGDPMGHGTEVLTRLLRFEPNAKVILLKAFENFEVCKTLWDQGRIVRPGWSEGYAWAAQLAESLGMVSVGNCSFGGYRHAMDGTGWESMQIGNWTGTGKPGHVLVAAAGYGDSRAVHGKVNLLDGERKTFYARQDGWCEYNCWFGLGQTFVKKPDWILEARLNGEVVWFSDSSEVPPNMWNNSQQLKFSITGGGKVEIEIARKSKGGIRTDNGLSVDLWAEDARLENWVSPELLPEPACFPQVLTVGLRASFYSALQELVGYKPEVLLTGGDQISFRLPEIVVAVGKILEQEPQLDVEKMRARLPKFWKNGV